MIKVLLADDHMAIRARIRGILDQSGECEVCGEASNGRIAVELALRLRPEVVVLDVHMPELNGFEAARRMRKAQADIEFLVLTMYCGEELVAEALEIGARSYMLKSDAGRHLVGAVRMLSRHQPYFTPQFPPPLFENLSGRRGLG